MTATPSQKTSFVEPSWLDDDTLRAVRPQVRSLLESSPGFRALSSDQQKDIAKTMVKVASYMANPDGLAKKELDPSQSILSRAQAGEVDQAKRKASDKVGEFAGKDFEAGAVKQGTQAFKQLVQAVDFPQFVGGLIQNVFQAIVTASIQQMTAYAELLKSVAQTVDQFAQDNISQNNARDWLMGKYPGQLTLDDSESDDNGNVIPRLNAAGDDSSTLYAQLNEELQLANPLSDISDAAQEARLVQAARLQMAKSRQQMLSSMVMLGINRIVVTDGAINAKVVFDMRASDQAQRHARASLYDRDSSKNTNVTGGGFVAPWGGAASMNINEQSHVTTVSSSVDENSESKAEVKAKLSGEVRVNFKSDYFPMDKLASPRMIAAIQGNATPYDTNLDSPQNRSTANNGSAAAPARQ